MSVYTDLTAEFDYKDLLTWQNMDKLAENDEALLNANLSIGGTKTFTGQLIGKGTITNDSANAGDIGEKISASIGATNFPTSGQWGDLTSISLTAGDWDVSLIGEITRAGSTFTDGMVGISVTSGNSSTGLTAGVSRLYFDLTGITFLVFPICLSVVRISLNSTTTVYFKYFADYSAAVPTMTGGIFARRVR